MKRSITVLMAGALILALSFQAAAQSDKLIPPARPVIEVPSTVTGTVVSVSSTSLVVQRAGGVQVTLLRDASSNVPESLSPGAVVRVGYETPAPGILHASSVFISTDGSIVAPPSQDAAPNAVSRSADAAVRQTAVEIQTLPGTASPLAIIGLLGILALGGAVMLRAIRG